VERGAWTDERLDDRFDQIDRRFDQIDRRLDRIELEMREGFTGVRAEINDLRSIMIRFNGAMVVGLLGVIAAIFARGA
jgi:hypothetical protein